MEVKNTIEINNAAEFINSHTVNIQRLDVFIPFWDRSKVPSGRVFYSIDNFSNTEQKWNTVPFIYIPKVEKNETIKHPDHELLEKDPEAAAKSVKGYIAGWVTNSIVYNGANGTGEPRAVSEVNFTCPIAEKAVQDGKVSVSTGFNAAIGNNEHGGYIEGKVIPSHLLGFPRAQCKNCFSNDNGAYFVNTIQTEEENNVTEQIEINNAVPPHTLKYGLDFTGRWRGPVLLDFTDKARLAELSEQKQRDIAAHFAYSSEMPPTKYTDLKLAHHNPKKTGLGDVNRRGVFAAMAALAGARGGVNIPEDEKRRVYEHLKDHYIEFGIKEEDVPEFNNVVSGEFEMADEITEVSLDQESKGLFKGILEKLDGIFEKQTKVDNTINDSDAGEVTPEVKPDMTEMDNIKADLEAKATEIDNLTAQITEKDTKITELDNTVKELQGKLDEFEKAKVQAAADAEWTQIKNSVPAGWLEDESKTRAEYEENKGAFALKLIAHANTVKTTEAEGKSAIGNNTVEPRKLGKYNPETGKYDEVD